MSTTWAEMRPGRPISLGVVDVVDVNEEPVARYVVRRVCMPTRGIESFAVIGPDLRPVAAIDGYLAWLTSCERSPNTIEGYAHDLRAFWTFLDEHGLTWERVGVMEIAEFAAWARRPARNVVVLADEAARLAPRTVNRMLTAVVGFYELQARRGNTLAKDLIVKTRTGRGGYKPFLPLLMPTWRRTPRRKAQPPTRHVVDVSSTVKARAQAPRQASVNLTFVMYSAMWSVAVYDEDPNFGQGRSVLHRVADVAVGEAVASRPVLVQIGTPCVALRRSRPSLEPLIDAVRRDPV
jgi:hypothetical protein